MELSPLLFVLAMIPLTMLLLKRDNIGYKLGKKKIKQEHLRMVKLVVRLKLQGWAINAWAIGVAGCSAGILDRSGWEMRAIDVKTRKRLIMFGSFHKKGSVVRL